MVVAVVHDVDAEPVLPLELVAVAVAAVHDADVVPEPVLPLELEAVVAADHGVDAEPEPVLPLADPDVVLVQAFFFPVRGLHQNVFLPCLRLCLS